MNSFSLNHSPNTGRTAKLFSSCCLKTIKINKMKHQKKKNKLQSEKITCDLTKWKTLLWKWRIPFLKRLLIWSAWNNRAKMDTVLLCWVLNRIFEMIIHSMEKNQEHLGTDNHISERVKTFEWPEVKHLYYHAYRVCY